MVLGAAIPPASTAGQEPGLPPAGRRPHPLPAGQGGLAAAGGSRELQRASTLNKLDEQAARRPGGGGREIARACVILAQPSAPEPTKAGREARA